MIKQRSKDELKEKKMRDLENKYSLVEQEEFRGTQEELKRMQYLERMYFEGRPEVSDEEWDLLIKKYNYKESISESKAQGGRRWIKMSYPLVSLKKIDSISKLEEWIGEDKEVLVQPKLDGVTFSAFYRYNEEDKEFKLLSIGSRGDGNMSLEAYPDAFKGVKKAGLPETISVVNEESLDEVSRASRDNERILELRGEMVVVKEHYVGKVHRTIASGFMNRKNPTPDRTLEIAKKNNICSKMDAIAFDWPRKRNGELLHPRGYLKNKEFMKEVNGQFVPSVTEETCCFVLFSLGTGKEIYRGLDLPIDDYKLFYTNDFKYYDRMERGENPIVSKWKAVDIVRSFYGVSDDLGFKIDNRKRYKDKTILPCDGVVIKILSRDPKLEKKEKHGKIIVPHHPDNAVAVKLKSYPNTTRIIKINETVTKLGNTTYSADIEPFVAEDGKIVRKLNLHNKDWLNREENKYIKEGAEILVYQAMDIISIPMPLNTLTNEELINIKRRK